MTHSDDPQGSSSRRKLLAAVAGSAAARAVTRHGAAQPTTRPPAWPRRRTDLGRASPPFNVLTPGGTGFIGPHQVQHARVRGHKVTIANRGRTRPEMYEGMDVGHIEYDRDQEPVALR